MHINATFLIQMIHFLITYYVLNNLLFKPAIASLQEQKQKKDILEQAIKTEEKTLLTLEKEKSDKLVAFQTHVKKQYPFIAPTIAPKPLEITEVAVEKIDVNKLKKEVIQLLVKEVPHGY